MFCDYFDKSWQFHMMYYWDDPPPGGYTPWTPVAPPEPVPPASPSPVPPSPIPTPTVATDPETGKVYNVTIPSAPTEISRPPPAFVQDQSGKFVPSSNVVQDPETGRYYYGGEPSHPRDITEAVSSRVDFASVVPSKSAYSTIGINKFGGAGSYPGEYYGPFKPADIGIHEYTQQFLQEQGLPSKEPTITISPIRRLLEPDEYAKQRQAVIEWNQAVADAGEAYGKIYGQAAALQAVGANVAGMGFAPLGTMAQPGGNIGKVTPAEWGFGAFQLTGLGIGAGEFIGAMKSPVNLTPRLTSLGLKQKIYPMGRPSTGMNLGAYPDYNAAGMPEIYNPKVAPEDWTPGTPKSKPYGGWEDYGYPEIYNPVVEAPDFSRPAVPELPDYITTQKTINRPESSIEGLISKNFPTLNEFTGEENWNPYHFVEPRRPKLEPLPSGGGGVTTMPSTRTMTTEQLAKLMGTPSEDVYPSYRFAETGEIVPITQRYIGLSGLYSVKPPEFTPSTFPYYPIISAPEVSPIPTEETFAGGQTQPEQVVAPTQTAKLTIAPQTFGGGQEKPVPTPTPKSTPIPTPIIPPYVPPIPPSGGITWKPPEPPKPKPPTPKVPIILPKLPSGSAEGRGTPAYVQKQLKQYKKHQQKIPALVVYMPTLSSAFEQGKEQRIGKLGEIEKTAVGKRRAIHVTKSEQIYAGAGEYRGRPTLAHDIGVKA